MGFWKQLCIDGHLGCWLVGGGQQDICFWQQACVGGMHFVGVGGGGQQLLTFGKRFCGGGHFGGQTCCWGGGQQLIGLTGVG